MPTPTMLKLALRRFIVVLIGSVIVVWIGSEIAFSVLKSELDRPPEILTLTIPEGTAIRVGAGYNEPSIPDELSFVVGDTLVVYNDDSVDHELGPLYIPAGSSASLVLEDAKVFEYTCSFRPSQYLGLAVYEGTTLNVRLIALSYVSPATAIIVFLYSLALFPLKRKEEEDTAVSDELGAV